MKMFDLKLCSSNVIGIELASCVGYIVYISANIITKKKKRKEEWKEKRRKGKGKGKGKKMGKGKGLSLIHI